MNLLCHLLAVCLVSEASVEVSFSTLRRSDCSWDACVVAKSVPSSLHLAVPLSAWWSCCYWSVPVLQHLGVFQTLAAARHSSSRSCQCTGWQKTVFQICYIYSIASWEIPSSRGPCVYPL